MVLFAHSVLVFFIRHFITEICNVLQAFYFPIDPRLNFFVANKLLKELSVRQTHVYNPPYILVFHTLVQLALSKSDSMLCHYRVYTPSAMHATLFMYNPIDILMNTLH